jgi:hypothetical protein
MHESKNNSRRDFFLKSAALGASAVIAGSSDLLAQKSSGAETSSRYGNGPHPADGMAGYSETGPLKTPKVPASGSRTERRCNQDPLLRSLSL